MARVTFLGLGMEDSLRARIVAAMRGLYPQQTEGLGDLRAAQVLLRMWVTELLAAWETRQAAPDPANAAKEAADEAAAARNGAEASARLAAKDIDVPT